MTSASPARQKVHPSLLFTQDRCGRAEEAIRFYTSLFAGSEVGTLSRYGAGQEPDKEGTLNCGEFSLSVTCENQAEIDFFWSRLGEGGSEGQCGWLKDRFGVSWQVVPRVLEALMADPERAKRVTAAFLPMKKLDIATLLPA